MEISNKHPEVSIIITAYNKPFEKVKRAIDSVLNQDFHDFEIVLVDDGGNTAVAKLLLGYAIEHPGKIVYIRHENSGQALSVNRGLLNSNGQYIGFLDGDDEYKVNNISICMKHLNEDCDLIASTTETIVSKPEDYYVPDRHNENINLHIDDCIAFGTLFGRKEVFMNIGFHNLPYALDSDFYERAGKEFITKKFDFRTYIYYRNSPDSVVSMNKKNRINNIEAQ